MCDKVEAYAKKEKIYSAIEIYVEEFSITKEQIIPKLTKRFNITKEDAESYYDDVFAVK